MPQCKICVYGHVISEVNHNYCSYLLRTFLSLSSQRCMDLFPFYISGKSKGVQRNYSQADCEGHDPAGEEAKPLQLHEVGQEMNSKINC